MGYLCGALSQFLDINQFPLLASLFHYKWDNLILSHYTISKEINFYKEMESEHSVQENSIIYILSYLIIAFMCNKSFY